MAKVKYWEEIPEILGFPKTRLLWIFFQKAIKIDITQAFKQLEGF